MVLTAQSSRGFFSSLCVPFMLLVLLFVAVAPTISQDAPLNQSASVEVIGDTPQQTMRALFVYFIGQVLLLWAIMFSYLTFSAKVHKERQPQVPHWWSRLHLRH